MQRSGGSKFTKWGFEQQFYDVPPVCARTVMMLSVAAPVTNLKPRLSNTRGTRDLDFA